MSHLRPVGINDGELISLFLPRGMGDSSLSPGGEEEITIELLARDLLFLLTQLKWKEVALCGHSMGGINPFYHPIHTQNVHTLLCRCDSPTATRPPVSPDKPSAYTVPHNTPLPHRHTMQSESRCRTTTYSRPGKTSFSGREKRGREESHRRQP